MTQAFSQEHREPSLLSLLSWIISCVSIPESRPTPLSELQVHKSASPPATSTWRSHWSLKQTMSEMGLLVSSPNPFLHCSPWEQQHPNPPRVNRTPRSPYTAFLSCEFQQKCVSPKHTRPSPLSPLRSLQPNLPSRSG